MANTKIFRKKRTLASFYVILIVIIAVVIHYFINIFSGILFQSSLNNLEDQVKLQRKTINLAITSEERNLTFFASTIAETDNIERAIKDYTNKFGFDSGFENIFYLEASARGYDSKQDFFDLTTEDFYPLLLQGKTVTSQIRFNSLGSFLLIVAPVIKDSQISGYVVNEINTKYLDSYLSLSDDDIFYSYIVDKLGNTIAKKTNTFTILPNETFASAMQKSQYFPGENYIDSFTTLESTFASSADGFLNIAYGTNERIGYVTPIGINSWSLITFEPASLISESITQIADFVRGISIALLLVILIAFAYIAFVHAKIDEVIDNLIEELTSRIDTDTLTRLFSRKETINRIENYLKYTHNLHASALMLIDLDNFHVVNNTFGEEYGDVVLRDAAQRIKNCFRSSDIVGRIDGNLFAVLMRNIRDENIVVVKANSVHNALKELTLGETNAYLTASIGIAFAPEHGIYYPDLMEKSDAAMFASKLRGKSSFTIFEDNLKHRTTPSYPLIAPESATKQFLDSDNVQSVLVSLFYGAKNIEAMTHELLIRIGTQFRLDRCSIFEYNKETKLLSNISEYNGKNIADVHDLLQNIQSMDSLMADLEKLGIQEYYLSDSLNEDLKAFLYHQQAKSALMAYYSYKDVSGFLLFGQCGKDVRIWNEKHYDIINFAVKLFTLRMRNDNTLPTKSVASEVIIPLEDEHLVLKEEVKK